MAKKLKLLLDENIGVMVAETLRREGYDPVSIVERCAGAPDQEVLGLARKERRILVTLDKDFGMLVYANSRKHRGVILLRLHDESPRRITETLLLVLNQFGNQLVGRFAVASERNIRIR